MMSVWVFYPGLLGSFLLDDFANLPALKKIEGITDWENILSFILSGESGPSGRPISLLTFALQASAWPTNPFPFKLVNVLIHFINGFLIYLLVERLLIFINFTHNQAKKYSLFITATWLLHPLQISTVFYVVQRMTELSALFTLSGLLIYLKGRTYTEPCDRNKSYLLMTSGIGIALLLGTLSKENAILACLYIAVIESTLLRHIPRPRYWSLWASIFIALPLIILAAYLLPSIINHIDTNYPNRPFNAFTRLLTESRVVTEYLKNFFIPQPSQIGIFHSDYTVSQNLFNPVSTLFSSIFLLSLILIAFVIRKIFPLISFGILWFFAGHLLESSVISLELYFEHRNYIPLLGPVFSLIGVFTYARNFLNKKELPIAIKTILAGSVVWIVFLVAITANESRLWGNPVLQAASWAEHHPHSYRAQGHYADILIRLKYYQQAKKVLEDNSKSFSENATHLLLWLDLTCQTNEVEPPNRERLLKSLSKSKHFNATFTILDEIIILKNTNKCDNVSEQFIEKIIHILKNNTNYQSQKARLALHTLAAKFYAGFEKYPQAIQEASNAYQIAPSVNTLLFTANIHLKNKSKMWYLQTLDILDHFCQESLIKCLPFKQEIRKHHIIRDKINNMEGNSKAISKS